MKNCKQLLQAGFVISIAALILLSCKKSNDDNTVAPDVYPVPVSDLVSQSMIDSLRHAGATINAGTTPPIVTGIFLMHPDSCIYDNSAGNFTGSIFDDYKFKFSNQDNSAYTIGVAQKAVTSGNISSTPAYAYISGNGNKFSIFILRTSSPSGIQVQQFNVLSGTVTAAGIQDLQNTLYMRSKVGDPTNTIAAAGTIRVFVTGAPGLATITGNF